MKSQLTLLIIGASIRAVAESATRSGFQSYGIDLFGDQDTRRVCAITRVDNLTQLRLPLPSATIDGWLYTGAIENHPQFIRHVSKRFKLLGCDDRVVGLARNPLLLNDVLSKLIPTMPLAVLAKPTTDETDWVCKPLASTSGRGITVGPFEPSPNNFPCYFQQRIHGASCSAVFLANGQSAVLIGATRQLTGKGELGSGGFRYCGSIGPRHLADGHPAILQKIGQAITAEFQLCGIFGVDYIENNAGIWPVEINPRFPASAEILERAWDVPLMDWHVRACRDRWLPDWTPTSVDHCWGKAILFSDFASAFTISESISRWLMHRRPNVADIPPVGTRVEKGAPITTVFARASADEKVWQELLVAAQQTTSRIEADIQCGSIPLKDR